MRKLVVPLVLGTTLACGGWFQSYAGGLQVICDAPNTCGERCANATASTRQQMLALHIDENLHNSDARTAFDALASASAEQRVEILRHEATENGIAKCALADLFESGHRELWSEGVANLCASRCAERDTSVGGVRACVDAKSDLPYEVQQAVRDMSGASPAALGTEIQKLAAKHGQPACALASTLRNAR